jgi:hypothetical protein
VQKIGQCGTATAVAVEIKHNKAQKSACLITFKVVHFALFLYFLPIKS